MNASYDPHADVLYLHKGTPRPVEGEEGPDGVELDFDLESGEPAGITVLGYRRNRWQASVERLAEIVGAHLRVSNSAAVSVIRKAVA